MASGTMEAAKYSTANSPHGTSQRDGRIKSQMRSRAGNDLRMSIDDEVIPVKKARYAGCETEQRCQHQALSRPSPPNHLFLRSSMRFEGAYRAQKLGIV